MFLVLFIVFLLISIFLFFFMKNPRNQSSNRFMASLAWFAKRHQPISYQWYKNLKLLPNLTDRVSESKLPLCGVESSTSRIYFRSQLWVSESFSDSTEIKVSAQLPRDIGKYQQTKLDLRGKFLKKK